MSAETPHRISFDDAAEALDIGMLSFRFTRHPDEQSRRLGERIKMAAKLLGRAIGLPHGKALEIVAQALRFRSWHDLSSHLTRLEDAEPEKVSKSLLDALSATVVLMVTVEEVDVAMPATQIDAFEQLGETLAMLTDAPKQIVMDAVSAPLCAGRTWAEVVSLRQICMN